MTNTPAKAADLTPEERAEALIDGNPCFYDATDFKEACVGFKRDEGVAVIAAAIREAVEDAAKIVDAQQVVYEDFAAKAETTMNRALNALGASTCKDLAFKIRTRK